ncbi:MAG: hypothetical protein U0353_35190, partial [Sandaracinus sp.]
MLVRRTAVFAALSLVVWAALSVPCVVARAQLAAGRRSLEAADFQRAIRAFDRAERTETLDREGLVSLYEGRIIARFAVGTRTRARRDLQILGELDPTHTFPVEVPPEVGEAFAEVVRSAGGGLDAALSWTDEASGSRLRVEVQRDTASIVTGIRVHTRVGEGPWSSSDAHEVSIPHAPREAVGAWVELLGPHDVVLHTQGSAEAPVLHGAPPPPRVEVATIAPIDALD